MKTFNLSATKERRRELRKNQTEAEKILWNKLRNKQLGGHKFFRQYGVGSYILDFYCPLLRVAIEVDGGQHYGAEGISHDNQRNESLKIMGIKVIRFSNLDVFKNIEGVFENIQKKLPLAPLYKKEGSL